MTEKPSTGTSFDADEVQYRRDLIAKHMALYGRLRPDLREDQRWIATLDAALAARTSVDVVYTKADAEVLCSIAVAAYRKSSEATSDAMSETLTEIARTVGHPTYDQSGERLIEAIRLLAARTVVPKDDAPKLRGRDDWTGQR